jgi:hypothetical protein
MIQFHSTPISEPAAQVCGLVVGLVSYGLSGMVTADHNTRLWIGMVASALSNLAVGAKINVLTLDFLALVVVRPISAAAGAGMLAMIANAISH